MAITFYLADRILDRMFGDGDPIRPDGQTIGLSTTTPGADGSNFTEPSGIGSGYQRYIVDPLVDWVVAGDTLELQQSSYDYTADEDWGTIVYSGLFFVVTPDSHLAVISPLETPKAVNEDQFARWSPQTPASWRLTLGNNMISTFIQGELFGEFVTDGGIYTPPASYSVGLSLTAVTPGGGYTEPAHASYARASINNGNAYWNLATGGVKTNSVPIEFVEATGSWGQVTHWFLLDDLSRLVTFGPLGTPVAVNSFDTLKFQPGALSMAVT